MRLKCVHSTHQAFVAAVFFIWALAGMLARRRPLGKAAGGIQESLEILVDKEGSECVMTRIWKKPGVCRLE